MWVTETKRKLDGRRLAFRCRALELGARRAALLYRHPEAVVLGGLRLPAGTRCFGLFWTDRPYNVYHFVGAGDETLACYCNAAAETRIGPMGVEWLDLEADVLIAPDGAAQVLDLEEVPRDLRPDLRAALGEALRLLGDAGAVLAEARAVTCALPRRGSLC
jgi:predicted RNA-binding protein associated with RNAse of E/G family